jgi:hypothetical protein
MDKYIHNENLKTFQKLLAEMTDSAKRDILLNLIRAEIARDVAAPAARH